jgi:hypothetical protein
MAGRAGRQSSSRVEIDRWEADGGLVDARAPKAHVNRTGGHRCAACGDVVDVKPRLLLTDVAFCLECREQLRSFTDALELGGRVAQRPGAHRLALAAGISSWGSCCVPSGRVACARSARSAAAQTPPSMYASSRPHDLEDDLEDDLEQLIRSRRFRDDLLSRLNVVPRCGPQSASRP